MKMVNKIRLMILPSIIVPMTLILVVCVYMGQKYASATYGSGVDRISSFANPTEIISELTSKEFSNMKATVLKDPDKFQDDAYVESINSRLTESYSYLVIRRNDEIIYRGSGESHEGIEAILPEFGTNSSSIDGGLVITTPENFLVKQLDFKDSSGNEYSIFILTNLEGITPRFKVILFKLFLSIGVIMIIFSTTLTWFIYSQFVRPINCLKEGTNRIKDGNLESDVEVANRDEIGELCESFNEMRVKLKESVDDRLKYENDNRELISNISHDLKTPITAIKGYVEGIMDGVADTPEKMDKYIKTIYNKANDMDALINELSIYCKIDNNSIPYNFSKINLSSYFDDCIEEISVDLESKSIDLGYFNYCARDILIIADAEQLKRVITNVVTNACKYNDKKKGRVNIRLKEIDNYVQVEIEDNGKGISKEDLPHIFDRMYRTDSSRNSATGGSGLGLSIAKKIIQEHGGKIWASSKEETGTIIYFSLGIYKEDKKDEQNINN